MKKKKKDIHEIDHLVVFVVIVAIAMFLFLTTVIFLIDFTFVRDPKIVEDSLFRIFLIVAAFILCLLFIRKTVYYGFIFLNKKYLNRFKAVENFATFEESKSQRFNPSTKLKHVVLLLHGFTASPQEFDYLIPLLKEKNIPFIAPNIFGFGTNSTELLETIRFQDWYRDVVDTYDTLSIFAENISVLGHSLGGLLAVHLAQIRPVHHLILSGPGIFVTKRDRKYKKILNLPIFSNIYSWLFPSLPKPIRPGRKSASDTLSEKRLAELFQYLAFPSNCLTQIFKAQQKVDLTKIKCDTLDILYGQHDETADNIQLLNFLKTKQIPFHSHCFHNSAHNILEDNDHEKACQLIATILKEH